MKTGNEVLMFIVACILLLVIAIRQARKKKIIPGPALKNSDNILEACAIVLSVEKSGIEINKAAVLKLQVQVLPAKGRNFIAELMVPDAGRNFVVGEKINVLYTSASARFVKMANKGL